MSADSVGTDVDDEQPATPVQKFDRFVITPPVGADRYHTQACHYVERADPDRIREATDEIVTFHDLGQCPACIVIETGCTDHLADTAPDERYRSTREHAESASGYRYSVGQRLVIEYQTPHAPGNRQRVEGSVVAIRESEADDAPEGTPEVVVNDPDDEDRDLILRGDRNAVWSRSYASGAAHQQRLGRLLDIDEIDGEGGDGDE